MLYKNIGRSSQSDDPFADAELFRRARLARQYGAPRLVEVAFDGGADPDPDLAAHNSNTGRLLSHLPTSIPRASRFIPRNRSPRVSSGFGF